MKAEEAGADLERLRALFAAERSANFPEFTDVYCVDAADDVLARFARARRGDPHAALQFLKEDYAWRKAEDAASLRTTPPADVLGQSPEVLAEYYRRRCVGLDCQGRLTFYQAYACCVVKKLKTIVPLENVVKYHAWEQERATAMLDELKRRNRGDGAMSIILDVAGMTIGKHINKDFIWLVKAIAAHDQSHYPERMGVTFIVNAPSVFGLVWRTVRPFIDPATRDKIRIVTARADWRAEVRAALGDDVVVRVEGDVDVDEDHARPPTAVAASLCAAVVGRDSEDSSRRLTVVEEPTRTVSVEVDAPPPLERSSSSAEIDELWPPDAPEQPPSPDSSTGLEAPLLPLEVSDDVKLERMETGDGDAAPSEEEASAPKKPRPIRRFEVLALAQVLAAFVVAAVSAGVLLAEDAGAFTGTALLAAVLALPLTALGLRAVYRRDADAFVMYTFLQLGLVLALCFLSVASLTVAANGRVSATVRFHRASVGCACLVQLLTSSATTYSSFGVHALFGA